MEARDEVRDEKGKKGASFAGGVRDALPIVLGYLPLGLAFGGLARMAGLTAGMAGLMSLLIYSGSGQFILVALLAAGSGTLAMIASVLLVNLRYLLLSASFAAYTRRLPGWFLALISAEITDESYAVSVSRFAREEPAVSYLCGLFPTAHLAWIAGSCAGAFLGGMLRNIDRWGLDFALPAMFICLLVWQVTDRLKLAVGLLAVALFLVLNFISFSSWNIILAALLAAAGGVVLEKWSRK